MSTIVITVKKTTQSKKTLVSNETFHKKYQIPNNETLFDRISHPTEAKKNGKEAYFLTIDLIYAFSQFSIIRQSIVILT